MRQLNTTTFELHFGDYEFFKAQGYAILSHRWIGAEVNFEQIQKYGPEMREATETSFQQDKIRGACATARELGYQWIWIDNCCINKASATEESESINSMFKWYRNAQVCITYLSDVRLDATSGPAPYEAADASLSMSVTRKHIKNAPAIFQSIDGLGSSKWFSRGWTLQELLAPREMRFYDSVWKLMGTKVSLASEIESITGIAVPYLIGTQDFRKACVATKMSWMAGRTTGREEDIAYSMLGLFKMMMVPRYGEGQRAFLRLQQELLSTSTDESIFAWKMPQHTSGKQYELEPSRDTVWAADEWGLLAPTPDWFKDCGQFSIEEGNTIQRPINAMQAMQLGVGIKLIPLGFKGKYIALNLLGTLTIVGGLPTFLYTAKRHMKKAMEGLPYPLNCWTRDEAGSLVKVSIFLKPAAQLTFGMEQPFKMKRMKCSELLFSHDQTGKATHQPQDAIVLQPHLRYDD